MTEYNFRNILFDIKMENTNFPYDPKWEQVEFKPPAKKII